MGIEARIADAISAVASSFRAFLAACGLTVAWAATGPAFDYSEGWQLVINTGTTIATFLMAFLIANNQARQAERDRAQLRYMLHIMEAVRDALVADTRPHIADARMGLGETQSPEGE